LALNLVLMFPCGLGIKGAAISTAVSEWLAAGAYVTLVWGKRELLGLWPPPQLQPAQLMEKCLPFLQVR
jgi:Na+-driven multidrug efflux pump